MPLKLPAGQLPSTQARLRDLRGGWLKADTSEAQRRRDGVHRASGRAQPAPHGQTSRVGGPVGPGWPRAQAQGRESRAKGRSVASDAGFLGRRQPCGPLCGLDRVKTTLASARCARCARAHGQERSRPLRHLWLRGLKGPAGRLGQTDFCPWLLATGRRHWGHTGGPTARHFQSNRLASQGRGNCGECGAVSTAEGKLPHSDLGSPARRVREHALRFSATYWERPLRAAIRMCTPERT